MSSEEEMIVCCVIQCAYCRAPIVSGARWVREKIYNPALNGRDPSLSLPKMLSGANAFEISDIEKMNIGAHQPGV
jgi:hypothetical protein